MHGTILLLTQFDNGSSPELLLQFYSSGSNSLNVYSFSPTMNSLKDLDNLSCPLSVYFYLTNITLFFNFYKLFE